MSESSSFLRHAANAVVYLRKRREGAGFIRAFLVSHPARWPRLHRVQV